MLSDLQATKQAVVANSYSNAELQRIRDALNKTTEDYGIKSNIEKTKVMIFSQTGAKQREINIDENNLEQVQHCYICCMVTEVTRMPHGHQKKDCNRKECFCKTKRLVERLNECHAKEKNNRMLHN